MLPKTRRLTKARCCRSCSGSTEGILLLSWLLVRTFVLHIETVRVLVFAVDNVLHSAVYVPQDLLYHFIGFRCCLCFKLYLQNVSG